jgi:hypothetical protein
MLFRRIRVPLVALVASAALTPTGAFAAQGVVGDSPAGYPGVGTQAVKVVGDTPADYAGVGTAVGDTPTTVVVRPQRTVVHTTNQVLPIALAALALAISLAGAGYVLVRSRSTWPAGVSH